MVELNLEPKSVVSITSDQGTFTSTEVKAPNQSHSLMKEFTRLFINCESGKFHTMEGQDWAEAKCWSRGSTSSITKCFSIPVVAGAFISTTSQNLFIPLTDFKSKTKSWKVWFLDWKVNSYNSLLIKMSTVSKVPGQTCLLWLKEAGRTKAVSLNI